MTTRPYMDKVNLDPVRADIRAALAAGPDADAVLDVVRPGLEALAHARTLHRRTSLYDTDCDHDEPDCDTNHEAWTDWDDRHPNSTDGEQICLDKPVADECPTCRDENGDHRPWPCETALVLGLHPVPPSAGEWNAQHPTGSPVTAWPHGFEGEPVATHTLSNAIAWDDTRDVVYVEGSGAVGLSHVRPRPECGCCVCAARNAEKENAR